MTFPHCNFEAHLVLGGGNRLKSSRSGLIDVCRARCGCRRTVTGRGGTVTYESAAVELDGTHRMIHESWPQGVLADYFLPLHVSWKGHVGSELVSVVDGCYISELEMEMAIVTFFAIAKENQCYSICKVIKHSKQIEHYTTLRFLSSCQIFFFALKKFIFFWSNMNFKDVH